MVFDYPARYALTNAKRSSAQALSGDACCRLGLHVLSLVIDQRNAAARSGEPSPPLSAYLARESKAYKQEVARAESEDNLRRSSERSEERRRERAAEERAEERAQEARYRSVTDFLNLAHAQGFCPADGRAFLKRATAYSTSPLQNDRPMGLWADDRRHALEPYLNDMTRCR